ncbi:hypothetical protein BBJ28_00000063 [Nothophytophthora sp. Chile5]|nr:hypothetical protein BBJ28_00000063 [Nothophytophthora sp. Chile5]
MELRCLTDDAELVRAVQKLNLGVLPVQPPAFCYRRAARDENRLSWAALVPGGAAGSVVGGAAIAELETERNGQRVVQLRTLAVEARYRRQGIGRKLVMQILQQAKEVEQGEDEEGSEEARAVSCVRLHVHAGNEDALGFYTQLGFTEQARIEDYYRHLEPRTALVMQYTLP